METPGPDSLTLWDRQNLLSEGNDDKESVLRTVPLQAKLIAVAVQYPFGSSTSCSWLLDVRRTFGQFSHAINDFLKGCFRIVHGSMLVRFFLGGGCLLLV